LTPTQQAEQLALTNGGVGEAADAPFLVAMAHHPIFSNDRMGIIRCDSVDWEPLLLKHKVHMYLAGHDHDMQHLEFERASDSLCCRWGCADLYKLKIDAAERADGTESVGFTILR